MAERGTFRTLAESLLVPLLLGASVFVAFLGYAGAPICMCAAPRAGSHPVPPPLSTFVAVLGPPLAVFLIGEFFALAPKRQGLRAVASAFVGFLTAITFAYCYMTFWPCCGMYAM